VPNHRSQPIDGRARLAINGDRRLRHAIEVRHDSFVNDEFRSLATRHGIAIVVADTPGKWPMMLDAASDFVYVRLHGDVRIYTSGYSDSALAGWTRRIRRWARDGRDVYVYFDNDVKVRAPFDALALMRRLGCAWQPGTPGENADLPRHAPDARIPRVSVRTDLGLQAGARGMLCDGREPAARPRRVVNGFRAAHVTRWRPNGPSELVDRQDV
jgi:uncharacterized protein DUF72